MNKDIVKALNESVLKGFFDMAFIEVIPMSSVDVPDPIHYTNIFAIGSTAPEIIQLQFFLPVECKKMIVENIYTKMWEEITSSLVDDCILEMINVVGGNFFSQYFGDQLRYEMGLPHILFDDSDVDEGKVFLFNAEGIFFKISVVS